MIERHRHIIDFTLASLLRRKGKNLSLFTVYTLLVFLLASVMFLAGALNREATLLLRNAPEIVVQRTLSGRYALMPAAYGDRLREIRGVISVRERWWGYHYDPESAANYTFVVPENFAHDTGSIAIGSGISVMRHAYEGDTMSFRGYDGELRNYKVKEILSEESQLVSADLILIAAEDYRLLAGIPPGYATDLVLEVGNSREIATIAEKVRKLLPDTRPVVRDEIVRTYQAAFNWRSGILIVILGAVLVAFAIFAWDKATGLSAEEGKEIGILKAVGWDTSDILFMKFWEATIVSVTAFMSGILIAYVHVFFTSSALFVPVLKGWSTLYPEFKLVPFINGRHIMALLFLTVVPYTVATIVPAWRAATIDPDSIMR